MTNEIHPAVEANNVNKRRRVAIVNSRRKACKTIILRAVAALTILTALSVAASCRLIAVELMYLLMIAVGSWISIWVGAWLQLMWGKEGLLK